MVQTKENSKKYIVNSCFFILTEDCNLRCEYCYENCSRDYKEYMPKDVIEKGVDYLVNNVLFYKNLPQEEKNNYEISLNNTDIHITLFGGEPLLYIDGCEHLVEYALKKCKEHNLRLSVGIITNSTIKPSKKLLDLMKQAHNFEIQFSIDGDFKGQNVHRKYKNKDFVKEETFIDVINYYKKILYGKETDYEKYTQPFNVHGVVTEKNVKYMYDSYRFYLDVLKIEKTWFYPIYTGDPNNKKEIDKYVKLYKKNLKKIAKNEKKFYIKQFNIFNSPLDKALKEANNILSNSNYKDNTIKNNTCGAGLSMVSLSPNGDLYPCHQFYFASKYKNDTTFKIGNIRDKEIINDKYIIFKPLNYETILKMNDLNPEEFNKSCYICLANNYQYSNNICVISNKYFFEKIQKVDNEIIEDLKQFIIKFNKKKDKDLDSFMLKYWDIPDLSNIYYLFSIIINYLRRENNLPLVNSFVEKPIPSDFKDLFLAFLEIAEKNENKENKNNDQT